MSADAITLDLPSLVGRTLAGKYEVVRPLGEGGMGAVYAVCLPDGTRAAAKVISRAVTGRDQSALRRFLRECSAATKVRDPNVVRVIELGADEELEVPFILMEMLVGEDLASVLRSRAPLEPTVAVRIARQAARGLAAAHAQGVVHRDVKPANLFLHTEEDGSLRVKVCDFGIAKQSSDEGDLATTELTRTGGIIGSPAYMSPEQAQSAKHVDPRSDVWSLSIVLYEALSGRRAWEGLSALGEILVAICTKRPTSLGEVAPWVDPGLAAVIERGLQHDPEARWQSAEELFDALEPFRGGSDELRTELLVCVDASRRREAPRGVATRPTGTSTSLSLEVAPRAGARNLDSSTGASSPVTTVARPQAPRRTRFLLAAAAVAGLGGGGAFLRLHESSSPTATATSPSAAPALLVASTTTLACPPLEASSAAGGGGWLGAAAADLACRRATWLLGGRVERTRTPAELLGLPRQPSESFPIDPYAEPEARARAMSTAQSSDAWLDGRVAIDGRTFDVTLELRKGTEHGSSGQGRSETLHTAVSKALAELEHAGALPRAAEIDPIVRAWEAVPDVATALAYDTIEAARYTHVADVAEPCAELWKRRAELGAFAWTLTVACVPPMKWPEAGKATVDRSSQGALAITSFALEPEAGLDTVPLTKELDAMRLKEASLDGRAMLAKAEGRLHLWRLDRDAARAIAANALRESPRDIELWNRLDAAAGGQLATVVPLPAWAPWSADAWLRAGIRLDSSDPIHLERLRRAHLLSPADVEITGFLGQSLIEHRKVEDARALAAIDSAGPPEARFAGALLASRIDAAEAAFQKALGRMRAAFGELSAFGMSTSSADGLLWMSELALLLGKDREVADEWIERFVLTSPTRLELDSTSTDSTMLLPMICSLASPKTAKACFATIAQNREVMLARSAEWSSWVAGCEAVSANDARGAAKAWQPLLQSGYREYLRAEIFDAAGQDDIAAKLDEPRRNAHTLAGIDRALPRAARRADKRGEHARAKELAEKTVSAWVMSDVELPDVRAMRRLVQP